MFSKLFRRERKKSKNNTKIAFTCKECGYTCQDCDLAPLCYVCHSGNDTFCPGCKSPVEKTKKVS